MQTGIPLETWNASAHARISTADA